MQLTGDRFTSVSASFGNDLSTLPEYPAEIRAPAGTVHGVSSFQVHISDHPITTPGDEPNVLVAMNPETAREDVMKLDSGAAVVYDEPLKLNELRSDLHFYPVPFDKLVAPVCPEAKLRKLVRNMIYDGVVAQLLSIEMEEIQKALVKQFGKKKAKAAELNLGACKAGFDYAAKTFTKADPYRAERMNATAGKILIEGNAACALGAMFAGVTVVTWYPITPSSSLVETLIGYMRRFRHDPDTGKASYAIVQAEDELASIGMALGGGWAGARSMTATAGPGISLMSEFIGLGYYAEIPTVIFDVERVGPSTGLPTRTAQGDLLTTALLSHGDTKHPMFFPSSPEECFSMSIEAFEFAEKFQTPVFVMTDLDLGMNNWMADPFQYPEKPIHRGKPTMARRGMSQRLMTTLPGGSGRAYRRNLPSGVEYRPVNVGGVTIDPVRVGLAAVDVMVTRRSDHSSQRWGKPTPRGRT
jgi:2-oxoglutarate ferredoxin oxidoreductase subunit alpha